MFKSRAVAYVNPVISCRTDKILGIGNGVRITRLFTSLKSDMNLTVLFFLGIINVGDAHFDVGWLLSTPNLHNRSTSFLRTSKWTCGIGNGQP